VPWRAALLGVATTGLGQLYSGRPVRAIFLNLLSNGMALGFIAVLFIPFKPWNVVLPACGLLLWWLLVLADAVRCAKRAAPDYRLKAYNRWYVYLLLIALTGVGQEAATPFLKARFIQAFKITTASTAPTLVIGDRFVAERFIFSPQGGALERVLPHRDPRRGDLVVFTVALEDEPLTGNETWIKRVIGLPGDHLRIAHRQAFVNGQPLDEPYVRHDPAFADKLRPGDDFPPSDSDSHSGITSSWDAELGSNVKDGELIVPPGKYFVLGDNREQSWDSRFWGFVPRADIFAKAGVIYFSWDAQARRVRWDRIGKILE